MPVLWGVARDHTGGFSTFYMLLAAMALLIAIIALWMPGDQAKRSFDARVEAKAMP